MTDHEPHDHALSLLALTLDPITPPSWIREQLLARATGPQRYAPFAYRLAALFDLSRERMLELLASLTQPDAFERAVMPGLRVMHFATGPAVIGRHAGFARVKQGFEFPLHRHLVEEATFVLEGMLVESDGRVHGPGDLLIRAPSTVHALTVVEQAVLATLVGPVDAA